MSPVSREFIAALVADCARYQARNETNAAEQAWWTLVALLGEREASRRLAAFKRDPSSN